MASLTRLLTDSDTGALPDPCAMTIDQYLTEWLEDAREQSPKTLERYEELHRNQIAPHLGGVRVRDLRAEQVRSWHGTLLDAGLSPRTVGHAHRLLRAALAPVVREDVLTRYGLPKVETEEIEILTEEQIAAVLSALEEHTLYPIVSLGLATGMRRGELLGLQWGDVDLDGAPSSVTVKRSVEETKAGLRLKPPKTERGRRSISLPPETTDMLRAFKVDQLKLRLAIGAGKLEDTAPVFPTIEGKLRSPHAVSRAWRRFLDGTGLPRVQFHALRHTHVSLLIKRGVDILTISRRIGHSKTSVTLDVYGHLIKGADAAAANAIKGLLK